MCVCVCVSVCVSVCVCLCMCVMLCTSLPQIYIHPSTTTAEVIRTAVEQLEKTRLDHGIPGQRIHDRDLPDFYLLSTHNHRDERILPKNFTPFELLNLTGKYRFYLRRWSLDQQTTEV